jgi:hypothetical protein
MLQENCRLNHPDVKESMLYTTTFIIETARGQAGLPKFYIGNLGSHQGAISSLVRSSFLRLYWKNPQTVAKHCPKNRLTGPGHNKPRGGSAKRRRSISMRRRTPNFPLRGAAAGSPQTAVRPIGSCTPALRLVDVIRLKLAIRL